MKLWKVIMIGLISVSLITLIGCGKTEEQPAEEPEEEVVAEAAVVDHTPAGEELGMEATCAVCGMVLTVEEGTPAVEYEGATYYFCTAEEKATFAANPDMYLAEPEEEGTTQEMEGEGGTE